LAVCGG